MDAIRLYVANTDPEWFAFLSRRQPLDEVNHWQPGGQQQFKALVPGELLVFRLRSPINKIAGYGVFARAALLPVSLAWSSFGEKNGHPSLGSLQAAIGRLKSKIEEPLDIASLRSPCFYRRTSRSSTFRLAHEHRRGQALLTGKRRGKRSLGEIDYRCDIARSTWARRTNADVRQAYSCAPTAWTRRLSSRRY